MVDKNSFMITLKEVEEIIRTSSTSLSREEILGYFKDMELSDEQKELVFTYLLKSQDENEEQTDSSQDTDDNTKQENENIVNDNMQYMPDSRMFQMYMEELADIRKYSEEEKENCYTRLASSDESVIKMISEFWLENVLNTAKEFLSPKYNLEDVIQEGNMALFLKLTDMCGQSCDNIEQEISDSVRMAMKEYISEITGEKDSENTIVGKADLVNEARKYLVEKDGFEPTVEELSQFTKIPVDELRDILDIIKKADANVR